MFEPSVVNLRNIRDPELILSGPFVWSYSPSRMVLSSDPSYTFNGIWVTSIVHKNQKLQDFMRATAIERPFILGLLAHLYSWPAPTTMPIYAETSPIVLSTHILLVPHICVIKLYNHWFRWMIVASLARSYYPNQMMTSHKHQNYLIYVDELATLVIIYNCAAIFELL